MDTDQSLEHFGLENLKCIGAAPNIPHYSHEGNPVRNEDDYDELVKNGLWSDAVIEGLVNGAKSLKERHENGDFSIRIWLDGFFWFPRVLMGIENHLYSFYDEPELYHKICEDLADYIIGELPKIYAVCKPDFMVISEDMSYNNGPMISKELFDEFLAPFYRKVIPVIHSYGIPVFVDSDGDITMAVDWYASVGADGMFPLERQAGVDVSVYLDKQPDLCFLGHFDKMCMKFGEEAMCAEFERILPAMKRGKVIPSVDHQTPPDVSIENYRTYVRLLKEYTAKATHDEGGIAPCPVFSKE